ncbi:alpha-L-fucosidase [Zhouia amylolytica]|uniref:alpha-L-fucosidase n=2 Tax=Zhouia amylolytica TaxID=376730 RepID=W2UP65_9FLAO|nr:alpha-L-fucosidase [Zhouia amylolytica]ETN95142.1 hypothetical protein P278_18970 [Zhouia amylolytica AD3]SFS68357.1 alpha-L-fucosidase [Zhouia amylolytica]
MKEKSLIIGIFVSVLFIASCSKVKVAEENLMLVNNTITVDTDDTKDSIVLKAAHVVPTPNQFEAQKDEFIAFVHFGPNTFTRKEWGDGMEDPKIFDLKELDTDQWCEAMKSAGMTKVILTVKHHDGFCLWQSRYTDHGIMSTGFRDGEGDVLKDLSKSCEKYGLKLGVYLSPADLYQIESPDGLYGNLSKTTKRTIPRPVEGRPFENKTTFEFEVDDYNEYFLNQLFELLTEYGPVHEVWFDGAHPKRKGGQQYNYLAWKELIQTLAPKAVIFGKQDIRWCGNEAGATRDTEWNVIPYKEDPNDMNRFGDLTAKDLGSREKLYEGKYLHYQPAETNTSIRAGWFYRDDTDQEVRGVDDVFDMYERTVGGNSIFLLNIPPNREGRFSARDVEVLREVGERIKETYTENKLAGAMGASEVSDDNEDTYVVLDQVNNVVELETAEPVTINRVVVQEKIDTHSERIEAHTLEAFIDNQWQTITKASNVGYKRILRFPEVTSNRFRIKVEKSRFNPAISFIGGYYYESRPPQLTISRTIDGQVTITPKKDGFSWKPHGENVQENINSNLEIRYTTDGSDPNRSSDVYDKAFDLPFGEVKAVAFAKDQQGDVTSEIFGIIKSGWKITEVDSEEEKHASDKSIDASAATYWKSKKGSASHFIIVDLGKEEEFNGFAYTPQQENAEGMLEKGVFSVSKDGKNWQQVSAFEFGNLINDPVTRRFNFKNPAVGRYIKIQSTRIAGGDSSLAIAELDIIK